MKQEPIQCKDNTARILTELSPPTTHPNRSNMFQHVSYSMPNTSNMYSEMVVSQTTCTKELQMEDIPITQHSLDHQIQNVTNEAFIIEGHPDQVINIMGLIHVIPIMSFIPPNITASNPENITICKGNSLWGQFPIIHHDITNHNKGSTIIHRNIWWNKK